MGRHTGRAGLSLVAMVGLSVFLVHGCDRQEQDKGAGRQLARRPSFELATPDESPRLAVEPTSHDVGKVKEGDTIERTFLLHNEGTAALVISKVVPRCASCMDIRLDRRQVPPGESAELVVDYELKDRAGPFARYIVVKSNDPRNESVSLILQGEAIPEFTVVPPALALGDVLSGEVVRSALTLTRNFGGPLEGVEVEEADSGLTAELSEGRAALQGEELPIVVTFDSRQSKAIHEGRLLLKVNGSVHTELVVPVTARIVSPVRLAENDVFFGTVPMTEKATRTVPLIVADGVDPAEITLECNADCVVPKLVAGVDGEGLRIELNLLPVNAMGPFSARVRLSAPFKGRPTCSEATCYGIRSG